MGIEIVVQKMPMYIAQARDPFQPYETTTAEAAAAAKKPKPVVPEASAYGALLVSGMLLLIAYRKYISNSGPPYK